MNADCCGYCNEAIEVEDDFINCELCEKNVHHKCLKNKTPGDLQGDVFFKFQCSNCLDNEDKESFIRIKMLWALVIIMAIYNLSIKSRGLSRLGYFHWRTHIVNYIDKNWEHIFGPNVRKKKTFVGTIAGCLSHNSPTIFTSGQEIFKEAGWWKLSQNEKPSFFQKLLQQDKKSGKKVEEDFTDSSPITSPSSIMSPKHKYIDFFKEVDSGNQCSRTIPYIAKNNSLPLSPKNSDEVHNIEVDNLNTVQSSLMDFLAESLSADTMIFNDVMPAFDTPFDMKSPPQNGKSITEDPCYENFQPRIVQVTNFQKIDDGSGAVGTEQFSSVDFKKNTSDDTPEYPAEIDEPCEASLFTKHKKRSYPWINDNDESDQEECSNIVKMNKLQEEELYQRLKKIIDLEDTLEITIPPKIRRLYRKLHLRNFKRKTGRPIFDIDKINSSNISEATSIKQSSLLDRYQLLSSSNSKTKSSNIGIVRLLKFECFESPFSGRVLQPFIYRSTNLFPNWLKLMCEIQLTVSNKPPTRASIDFCYMRPSHIKAVNTLLQSTFWTGIDLSECLNYPDYTVVVLYKKLVVGCASLIPDVKHNEAYISFMAVRPSWQRAGIATFMLYHLLQTSITKDITLHISVTNPAICLYQKFGFKIEEFIPDFYEKYLPCESTQSKNAFLMRMHGASIA